MLHHAATPTAGTHLRGTDAGHRVKHKCFTASTRIELTSSVNSIKSSGYFADEVLNSKQNVEQHQEEVIFLLTIYFPHSFAPQDMLSCG